MDNCIVLTGGGTAGHVSINLSLENELKKHFKRIVYIASKNGIENELVKSRTSYEIKQISTVKFERNKFLKNFLIPFKLKKAVSEAGKILTELKPSLVFSKGGYVGLPVVISAKKLGIPVVCHESDLTMGLSNKIAKKYADVICTNFEKTAKDNGKKCKYTGMPLILSNFSKEEAKKKLQINSKKPVLVVTGGSLGSKAINDFVFENVNKLTQNFYVFHLVGKNNFNKQICCDDYRQVEFSNDMPTILRACDFAISRAGANTIFELMANLVLTIFVPLPKTVSRGDQIENALFMEKQNFSVTCTQENLTYKKVQNLLKFLENNGEKIKNSIKNAKFVDATDELISIILTYKK